MGFVVLHMKKAHGTDAGTTAHIERTVAPKNADPARTHLNQRLVEYPEGVDNRTQTIQHRLDTAGLTRKIANNQVRAICINLSGSAEDMERIELAGQLGEWCADSLDWLKNTYGAANIVSADLHLDETTPHIHATLVPIVTGERRKAKDEQAKNADKKKYKKKSPNAARLCADDVMTRDKLTEYQDTYAEAMAKYGLQRGIEGSEAKHVTTTQWYRDLTIQNESLKENVGQLQQQKEEAERELLQQKEQAERELSKVKSEISKEKFKNTAAEVGSNIVEGIGSVIGTSKVKKQQQEIDYLKVENVEIKEKLGNEITQLKAHIRATEAEHKSTIGNLSEQLGKIYAYFPHLEKLLNWEAFLKTMGLPQDMIRRLFNREEVQASGDLYSKEHSKNFHTESATLKLEQDPHQPSKIRLTINGTDIFDWFKQKQKEFLKSIGINPKQNNNHQHKMQ